MTVKQYIKKNGWQMECDKTENHEVMTVNVGFINDNNMPDETQFNIASFDIQELSDLFADFCKENNFKENTVEYIEIVSVAESFEELESKIIFC